MSGVFLHGSTTILPNAKLSSEPLPVLTLNASSQSVTLCSPYQLGTVSNWSPYVTSGLCANRYTAGVFKISSGGQSPVCSSK